VRFVDPTGGGAEVKMLCVMRVTGDGSGIAAKRPEWKPGKGSRWHCRCTYHKTNCQDPSECPGAKLFQQIYS
jgi:hypothetical protein